MKYLLLISVFLGLPQITFATTYVFTIIDHPDGIYSRKITAINNNGTLGGYYYSDYGHSFLFEDNEFIPFNYAAEGFTKIIDMNDNKTIVLSHELNGSITSYLFADDTFTPFLAEDTTQTSLHSVNNAGKLAVQLSWGTFPLYTLKSFTYDETFTDFSISDALWTYIRGINNQNIAVGSYLDLSMETHIVTKIGGEYFTTDIPDAQSLEVAGINDNGSIAGSFYDGTNWHGFILTDSDLQVISSPAPTDTFTRIYDINNAGQIVGSLGNSDESHGYLASPYYMDSDADSDSDGQDIAILAQDIKLQKNDQGDLENFALNFGKTHFFTNLQPAYSF
ncbi:MAG: DUF3466 family protein [Desulfobulbaceae bacterium]|nr:DUF3466 family protein [Desulfobulbaceae bacterium]